MHLSSAVSAAACALLIARVAHAQPVRCVEDSPERHGQPGCSIVAHTALPFPPPAPAMWNIDEFPSLAEATRAAGTNGVAFEAHGSVWLSTIESDTTNHHGGKHRASVGPLPLTPGRPYSMQVMSAYFLPGNFTSVHTHSGPEAWWVLEGEQCLETPGGGIRKRAGEGAIVEGGQTMRLLGIGAGPRRALVLILHDSDRPATTFVQNPPPLQTCR